MSRSSSPSALWVLCGLLAISSAAGVQAQAAPPPRKLRVGYAGAEPFVVGGRPPRGISVEVWHAVASSAGLDYELVERASVASALDEVASGQLDVAIGPISITADRARRMHFTQPYYQAELAIIAPAKQRSWWSGVEPFIARLIAGATAALIVSLTITGTLVWLAERRKNPEQFPPDPVRGIGNGMWLALVTMTTVGYGDRAPVTLAGRLITAAWMLIALLTTTSMIASVASAFTVLRLEDSSVLDARSLHERPVAVVAGTTGARFAAAHDAQLVPFHDFASAIRAVEVGRTSAMVHDRPMLQYYLAKHPSSHLKLAPTSFEPQGYGFAVSSALGIVAQLDVALLAIQEQGQVAQAAARWLTVVLP